MIGKDKFAHFFGCAFITLACALVGSVLAGAVAAILVGFVRELWNEANGGKFDWYDIAANVCGIAAAWATWLVIT